MHLVWKSQVSIADDCRRRKLGSVIGLLWPIIVTCQVYPWETQLDRIELIGGLRMYWSCEPSSQLTALLDVTSNFIITLYQRLEMFPFHCHLGYLRVLTLFRIFTPLSQSTCPFHSQIAVQFLWKQTTQNISLFFHFLIVSIKVQPQVKIYERLYRLPQFLARQSLAEHCVGAESP